MNIKEKINSKLLLMIVGPVLRRVGTAIAAYLVAKGFPADAIDQLLTAVGVALGLGFDLVMAHTANRRVRAAHAVQLYEVEKETRLATIERYAFDGAK